MGKFIDLTGQKFGRLTVLERAENKWGKARWKCRCSCGNLKIFIGADIRRGDTKSCGCLLRDATGSRFRSHGLSGTREYNVWGCMKGRCLNENNHKYPYYGGAGITLCEEWKESFEEFYAHIGPMPKDGGNYSVDRINNKEGYRPGNVRWALDTEQARNKNIRQNNKTGITGVQENEKYFVATWYDLEGVRHQKCFSKKTHGEEKAKLLAAECREGAIRELNQQGAGYSENHGK